MLVLGGSQGAKALNEVLPQALSLIAEAVNGKRGAVTDEDVLHG